jgi:hypothetical protein
MNITIKVHKLWTTQWAHNAKQTSKQNVAQWAKKW